MFRSIVRAATIRQARMVAGASAVVVLAAAAIAYAATPVNGTYQNSSCYKDPSCPGVGIYVDKGGTRGLFDGYCPHEAKGKYYISASVVINRSGHYHFDKTITIAKAAGFGTAGKARVVIDGQFVSATTTTGYYQIHAYRCPKISFSVQLNG